MDKCKRWIYNKTVNNCRIYSSLEEAFEFCWSSFADEHNTSPKSTKRKVNLIKFAFGTPWLPDLLCKHGFTSSVWNFCRWVADVPPCETSQEARSEEKRMFSQAKLLSYQNHWNIPENMHSSCIMFAETVTQAHWEKNWVHPTGDEPMTFWLLV